MAKAGRKYGKASLERLSLELVKTKFFRRIACKKHPVDSRRKAAKVSSNRIRLGLDYSQL